ncbi:MAG TPA: type II toxin-antitoxin system HigB family toxin [Thermoleophilia bacterium]|nr:type II toxin-antitoxin system HigB family toxin [Thermoleophilia bacterium]
MRIVGRDEVQQYMKNHADVRIQLQSWLAETEAAAWLTPQDVLDRYPRTSFIRKGLAVFNIKGNDYRLVAQIGFNTGIVRVLKVGTHAEYDTWTL